jgi:acyl-CoA thioesterase
MKLTNRDRVLVIFLPAMIVLLVYGVFHFMGPSRTQARLSVELDKLRTREPAPAQVQQALMQAYQGEKQMTESRARLKSAEDQWRQRTTPPTSGERRPDRLSQLLAILKKRGVHVSDHAAASASGGNEVRLSPTQEKLASQMVEQGGKQPPQVWRFQLVGTYTNILHTLRELSESEPLAIPLGLTMKSPEGTTSHRVWTLLLWI